MFLLLCASGDNSGIFLDSPYCRSFCYDNNRASVRTCPCKPLLTLSIIAVMKKEKKIQLSRAAAHYQRAGRRPLLFFSSSYAPCVTRRTRCSLLPAAAERPRSSSCNTTHTTPSSLAFPLCFNLSLIFNWYLLFVEINGMPTQTQYPSAST